MSMFLRVLCLVGLGSASGSVTGCLGSGVIGIKGFRCGGTFGVRAGDVVVLFAAVVGMGFTAIVGMVPMLTTTAGQQQEAQQKGSEGGFHICPLRYCSWMKAARAARARSVARRSMESSVR